MLAESFLRSLNRLRLAAPGRQRGQYTGERRSHRFGRSMEFADYRAYTPGDDPRRVDWNLFARYERPYVKRFEDEEDMTVSILLDASASMRWVDPEEERSGKWERACDLALALAYIGLAGGDRVVLATSSEGQVAPRRGVGAMSDFLRLIERETARAPQRVSPAAWLRRFASTGKPGLRILVSDGLDADGFDDGFTALGGRGMDVWLLHTLCPAELEPRFTGDLRFKDVETDAGQDVSIDAATLSRYHAAVTRFSRALSARVRRRGGRYYLANTAERVETLTLGALRREGWLLG